MRFIYKIIRFLRRLPQRLFGRHAPKFLGDLYDAVKYANWIELIPTALAIVLKPRHFYRRLNRTLDKKGIFLNPWQYACNGFSFLITAVFFLYPRLATHPSVRSALNRLPGFVISGAVHVTKVKLGFAIALFALLTPVWILPLSALIYVMLEILSRLLRPDIETDTGRRARLESLNHELLLLPFAKVVYRRLDKRRFGFALSYYGITAFVLIHIVIAVYAVTLHKLGWVRQISVPGANLFAAVLIFPTIIAEALLIRPYIELLRSSCIIPPIQFHRERYKEITVSSEIALKEIRDLASLRGRWARNKRLSRLPPSRYEFFRAGLVRSITSSLDRLQLQINEAVPRLNLIERDYRTLNAGLLNTLRHERTQAFEEALQLDNLRQAAEESEIPEEVRGKVYALTLVLPWLANSPFSRGDAAKTASPQERA